MKKNLFLTGKIPFINVNSIRAKIKSFFAEIVKKLPESTVDLEVYAHLQTIIRSGKAEYKLNGLNAEDYPQLPQMEEQHMYSMPIDLLKNIIRQTIFAVSTSETRPVLTGVNWRIEDGQLICIATDSHRLAMRKTVINGNGDSYSVVVPGKSLSELSKILDDTDEEIKIIFTETKCL